MNMKTEQDKALAKIKKCLKLAGSSNANEAATALRQAQALMAQHAITLTDVQAAEVKRIDVGATVKAQPANWETMLASVVADAFGCKLLFCTSMWPSQRGGWRFIGVDITPELAGYAFEVLLRQLKKDRAEYTKTQLKRCKLATKRARAFRFCEAWVFAVSEKVTAIAPEQNAETAIAAYMQKHHEKAVDLKPRGNTKTSSRGEMSDRSAGFLAGKQAQLSRGVNSTNARKRLEADHA